MKRRKALLIGVPEYESDALEDLPVVLRDLEILQATLEQSRYAVRVLGTEGIEQTGQNKILRALRKELLNAKDVDVLLLYFSGHGVHFEGKDYLIPSDADFDDPAFTQYLITPEALSDAIDSCRAKTILFLIDACRHGMKLGVKDIGLTNWSRGEVKKATHRSYVLVFSCGPGQVSQYVRGEDGFSLFTKALVQSLEPAHPAIKLNEVLQSVQENINTLAEKHGKKVQKVRRLLESEIEDDTLERIICESESLQDSSEENTDPWSEAVLGSPLWPPTEINNENSTINQLKSSTAKLTAACWKQWKETKQAFKSDVWRDENLPIRVIERLDLLVSCSDPVIELSLAEISLAISVPFVREAVLSSSVSAATQFNPLSLSDTSSKKDGLGLALDKLHQAQPRFIRKAKRLKEQEQVQNKDAVMTWLMHRCLLKSLEVWQTEDENGYLSKDLHKAMVDFSSSPHPLVKATLTSSRLIELSRCMFADFERIDRDDRPEALQAEISVRGHSYREEQVIREKLLAYLLKLAWLLAIDIRTLSDVVADHIGLADPLTPEEAIETIAKTEWKPAGRGRKLTVKCHHPAVDLALNEHVEYSSIVLTHIFRQIGAKVPGLGALVGLPSHFLPDGIEPEVQNGKVAYQKPHINFHLSHDEVRELLMGEQLYGDPTLAIRELYQNALDACRYKDARLQYLKAANEDKEGLEVDWEGVINFRQSTDVQGRAYIECEDNGIGMGMQHLSQCFAKAGKRFADLPEFIEEQTEWLQFGVRLYPNSQFGVGVLSYFMLADEIEIDTCRLDRKGFPGERLRVRIPGSSGLFRIQKFGKGVSSGTKIRIYLNRKNHKGEPISCLNTLNRLLWVAEYKTVINQGGRHEVWKPGQIKNPKLKEYQYLEVENPQLWWISNSKKFHLERVGCILVDGIFTESTQSCFVINLTREHYPKLTVDRKKIVDWNKQWVYESLVSSLTSLSSWDEINFPWLWGLSLQWPRVAEQLCKILEKEGRSIKLSKWSNDASTVSVSKTGCFSPDSILLSYGVERSGSRIFGIPSWLISSRAIVWGECEKLTLPDSWVSSLPTWFNLNAIPHITAEDAFALRTNIKIDGEDYISSRIYTQKVPAAHIALVSKHLDESADVTYKRLFKFSCLGLKIPVVVLDLLENVRFDEQDCILITAGNEDSVSVDYKLSYDRPSVPFIVAGAEILAESVFDVFKRFSRMKCLGIKLPQVDESGIQNIQSLPEDLYALSELSGNFVYPSNLLFISENIGGSIHSVIDSLSKYSVLGLTLPRTDIQKSEKFSVTKEDLRILSNNLDGVTPLERNRISVLHLIKVARYYDESIQVSSKRFSRFKRIGLRMPEIDLSVLDEMNLSSEDLSALPNNYCGDSAWPKKLRAIDHLLKVSREVNETFEQVLNRTRKYETIGLEMPDVDLDLLCELIDNRDHKTALSERAHIFDENFIRGRVYPYQILSGSLILKESVSDTFSRFQKFGKLLRLILPDSDPESWNPFS